MIVCKECSTEESVSWNKSDDGDILCNECYCINEAKKIEEQGKSKVVIKQESTSKTPVRKSARINRSSKLPPDLTKSPREKFIPKNVCYKAPDPVLTPLDSDRVFYRDRFFQKGDIVACHGNGLICYAQLRGFLTDQYCEKSTVVTWLLPTKSSPPPKQGFDPSSYIIGAEEDKPRSLSDFEFIMHSPSEYFMSTNHPYPPQMGDPFKCGYIPDPTL